MKTTLLSTLWLFLLFPLQAVFAIGAPSGLSVDETTTVSATLSWESVDNAAAYSIYYWVDPSSLDEKDLVETSPYTLLWLENNTIYYAAVVANDDSFEESLQSEQITFTTWNSAPATTVSVSSSSSFALENVEVLSETKLKLSFNADINSGEDSPREFKITNKFDELERLVVFDSEIDEQEKNTLILTMENPIPTSAQYNVTVVRLNNEAGSSIQNGIDGIASFITPDSFEEVPAPVVTAPVIEQQPIVEEQPELTAAGPTQQQPEVSRESSGQNISDDDLAKSTEYTAKTAEELPTTGAEHWFLGILALLLWAVVYKFRFSKIK